MLSKTVADLVSGLKNKKFSSVEITKHYLNKINKSNLNAFISINDDIAIKQAEEADKKIANGSDNLLTGIPYAHKDIFCTKGIRTTAGSKMLDNFIAPYDATVSDKLNKEGMVLLGKTNMDEFAMGSSTENSYYGVTKNPIDTTRVPGGSSGGSAAAVAGGLAPVATGTDTGGSIRQPASLCGITGLKPTYGRISRYGMIAFSSSLDQAGPMAKTAEDTALMLGVMSGFDDNDSTSCDVRVPDYTENLNKSLSGLKVGLPKEFFTKDLDTKIASAIDLAVLEYQKLGVEFKEVSLPNTKYSIATYYIIAPCECSSNLSRYDGVRYGYRSKNVKNLDDLYIRSRSEAFGDEVKMRIMVGTYALSAGYYDAYYLKAKKMRRLISNDFKDIFKEIDVIMTPTSPNVAFAIDGIDDHISMYLSDTYTISANLAGLPAISIPAGAVNNLPVGLQIIGNYWDEAKILNVAHKFQQQTDWHNKQSL